MGYNEGVALGCSSAPPLGLCESQMLPEEAPGPSSVVLGPSGLYDAEIARDLAETCN